MPSIWLVNPAQQTLEVLRLGPEGYVLLAVHTSPGEVRAEPFEAVGLDLALLFGPPPAPPGAETGQVE